MTVAVTEGIALRGVTAETEDGRVSKGFCLLIQLLRQYRQLHRIQAAPPVEFRRGFRYPASRFQNLFHLSCIEIHQRRKEADLPLFGSLLQAVSQSHIFLGVHSAAAATAKEKLSGTQTEQADLSALAQRQGPVVFQQHRAVFNDFSGQLPVGLAVGNKAAVLS